MMYDIVYPQKALPVTMFSCCKTSCVANVMYDIVIPGVFPGVGVWVAGCMCASENILRTFCKAIALTLGSSISRASHLATAISHQ